MPIFPAWRFNGVLDRRGSSFQVADLEILGETAETGWKIVAGSPHGRKSRELLPVLETLFW